MVGSGSILRGLLGFVFLFGFLCLLCFGMISSQPRRLATITVPSRKNFELVGKQSAGHHSSHLHYVSKRRVPNGPDPIHNRRAGKSTRPPVRA